MSADMTHHRSSSPSPRTDDDVEASAAALPANVRVIVRVRPLNDRERKSRHGDFGECGVLALEQCGGGSGSGGGGGELDFGVGGGGGTSRSSIENGGQGGIVHVHEPSGGAGGASFAYDAVFGPRSQQAEVFGSVRGIVDAVCAGYNGTIVAYGQTGSGKTHTIFGDLDSQCQDGTGQGLIQRSIRAIYHKIAETHVAGIVDDANAGGDGNISATTTDGGAAGSPSRTVRTTTRASFYEIFNERVYDLLAPGDDALGRALSVREDAARGVHVEGLEEVDVQDTSGALDILRRGTSNRHVAATNMNRTSSRSHAVFVLRVRTVTTDGGGGGGCDRPLPPRSRVRMSKFTLVDLAGSERQRSTDAAGERLKEAGMINNSLLCLGQVIHSLVDKNRGHVPFRDSKLTFLLRDSWGGNSKTCLVATVTPAAASFTETLSTLKFAQRAKLIKNSATLNEERERGNGADVQALQSELARLRSEVTRLQTAPSSAIGAAQSSSTEAEAASSLSLSGASGGSSTPTKAVVASALRSQNKKLHVQLQTAEGAVATRKEHTKTLKRKLQQETFIRKCKERRLMYLQGRHNRDNNCENNEESENVSALCDEVLMLRKQLDARSSAEAGEWLVKYEEERARAERMEVEAEEAANDCSGGPSRDEIDKMERTVAKLAEEKEDLLRKVDDLSSSSSRTQIEIDAILSDVTKLEDENVRLREDLRKREDEARNADEKARASEAHLESARVEMRGAVECLEAAQADLATERECASALRESASELTARVGEREADVERIRADVLRAEEDVARRRDESERATSRFEAEITELSERDAASVLRVGELTAGICSERKEVLRLEIERNEVAEQAKSSNDELSTTVASLHKQEERLRAEIQTLEGTAENLEKQNADASRTSAERAERLESELGESSELAQSLRAKLIEAERQMSTVRAASDENAALVGSLRIRVDESSARCDGLTKERKAWEGKAEALAEEKRAALVEREQISSDLNDAIADLTAKNAAGEVERMDLTKKLTAASERNGVLAQASQSYQEIIRAIREEKRGTDDMLVVTSAKLESALADASNQTKSFDEAREEMGQEIAGSRKENHDLGVRIEEASNELERVRSEHSQREATVRDAHGRELSDRDESITSLARERDDLRTKALELSTKCMTLTQLTESSTLDLEALGVRSNDLENQLNAVRSECVRSEAAVSTKEKQIKEAMLTNESLRDAHGRELANRDESITSLACERDNLRTESSKLLTKWMDVTQLAESSKRDLDASAAQTADLKSQLEAVLSECAHSKAAVSTKEKQMEEAMLTNESLRDAHGRELAARDESISSLARERDDLRTEASELSKKWTDATQLAESSKQDLEALGAQTNDLKYQLEAVRSKCARIEAAVSTKDKQVEEAMLTNESLRDTHGRELSDRDESIASFARERDNLRTEASELSTKWMDATQLTESSKRDLDALAAQTIDLESQLQAVRSECTRSEVAVSTKEKQIEEAMLTNKSLLDAHGRELSDRDASNASLARERDDLRTEAFELSTKWMDATQLAESSKRDLRALAAQTIDLESQLKAVRSECARSEAAVSTKEKQIEEATLTNESFRDAHGRELSDRDVSITSLARERDNLRTEALELSTKFSTLTQLTESSTLNLEAFAAQTTDLEAQLQAVRSEYTRSEAAVLTKEKQIKEAMLTNESLQQKLVQAEKSVVESKDKEARLESSAANVRRLEDEVGRITTDKQALSEKVSTLARVAEEGRRFKDELDNLFSERMSLSMELDMLRDDYGTVKEKLSSLTSEHEARLEEGSDEKTREICALECQLLEAEMKLAQTQVSTDVDQASTISRLEDEVKSMGDDNRCIRHKNKALSEKMAEEGQQAMSDLKKTHAEKSALAFEYDSLQEDQDAMRENVKSLLAQVEALEAENSALRNPVAAVKSGNNNKRTEENASDPFPCTEDNIQGTADATNPATQKSPPMAEADRSTPTTLDDSFDEDMFLPNAEDGGFDQATKTISTPIVQKVRNMFSPTKGGKITASYKAVPRTPLGVVAAENTTTPARSSAVKIMVRTNWYR